MPLSPEDEQLRISTAKDIVRDLANEEAAPMDLTGFNFSGVDLSGMDLSKLRADSVTLSKASGLETARGLDPHLRAEAIAIRPCVERRDDLNRRLQELKDKKGVVDNLLHISHGGVKRERGDLQKQIKDAQAAIDMAIIHAGVAAEMQPQVQNEFEHKSTYHIGPEITRSAEGAKDKRLEAMQASDTFRVSSETALNDQGSKVAFGKMQIGSKSARLMAEGAPANELGTCRMQESLAIGNAGALYGTDAVLREISEENIAQKLAAVGGEISGLLSRSVATSVVDKALGMNVMAEEKFGVDEQGRNVGISVGVPGVPILKRPDTVEGLEACLNIDYDNAAVQKGLFDLEAQDYITGQVDRHTGNIFIDPNNGKVSGIDNDLAFPIIDRRQMVAQSRLAAKVVANKPLFLHRDTADKIEALSPEALRQALTSIQPPAGVAGLEPAAIEGAVNRLQELQDHIKELRREGRVVKDFTPAIFAKAMEIQEAQNPGVALGRDNTVPRTSYLASAVIEQQRSLAMGNQREMTPGESVRPVEIDAKFAAYKQAVAVAKTSIAANPAQLQDTRLAREISGTSEAIARLQRQLDADTKYMAAAQTKLQTALEKNDQPLITHFSATLHSAQEVRQNTLQQLAAASRYLDSSLNRAVERRKPAIAEEVKNAHVQAQWQGFRRPAPAENQGRAAGIGERPELPVRGQFNNLARRQLQRLEEPALPPPVDGEKKAEIAEEEGADVENQAARPVGKVKDGLDTPMDGERRDHSRQNSVADSIKWKPATKSASPDRDKTVTVHQS